MEQIEPKHNIDACIHKFMYSHKEQTQDGRTTGTLCDTYDVTVCRNCGDVRRIQYKYFAF